MPGAYAIESRIRGIAGLVLLLLSSPATWAQDHVEPCDQGATAEAVADRRALFNQAIARAELDPIEALLADDVVLVAGTHSDLFVGKEVQLDLWRNEFASNPDRMVYERTPTCIHLSSLRPMAMERGRWIGENRAGDQAAGRYSAKWRRVQGQWKLEAEIFMTESCAGGGCP
jgi:ketosteroid isomerase-like protein